MSQPSTFDRIARRVTRWAGSPVAVVAAFTVVLGWFAVGLWRGFDDSHHLMISTITTIATFCMVFIIQAGQNRSEAEIKSMLREITEDLPDVDEKRAEERVAEEAKR